MLHSRTDALQDRCVRQRYYVGLARADSEIRAAQKLRRQILADEFEGPGSRPSDTDADIYDAHCEHLVVRDETEGRIVGTYRVLAPDAARCVGSYDAESEFCLAPLSHLRPQLVEVGRACVAPGHRNGAVIALLWLRLAEYMARNGYGYLIGCASLPMHDGGHNAANLFMQLGESYLSPADYRIQPHVRLPYERLATDYVADVPPLVKGYLRAGAWICGEPAWNPHLNSADLLMLLPMARLSNRYQSGPRG